MTYAIISLGGKQYRVQEGERLVVDRLPHDEGKRFQPSVLLVGGDGDTRLAPDGVIVTARVVGHVLGEKIRIGKYKPKSGYKRHTGYRSRLTQLEIEVIGASKRAATKKADAPEKEAAARKAERGPAAPKGMPKDYEGMTVAEVSEGAKSWNRPMLEAALEYERANANRKGAVSALESALAAKESD